MTNLISGKEALIAVANGEEVESRHREMSDVWDNAKCLSLVETFLAPDTPREFRLKPRTIKINGVECPAPETEPLKVGQVYFMPEVNNYTLMKAEKWNDNTFHNLMLKRGLIHLTPENAMAHSKAFILASGGSISDE